MQRQYRNVLDRIYAYMIVPGRFYAYMNVPARIRAYMHVPAMIAFMNVSAVSGCSSAFFLGGFVSTPPAGTFLDLLFEPIIKTLVHDRDHAVRAQ